MCKQALTVVLLFLCTLVLAQENAPTDSVVQDTIYLQDTSIKYVFIDGPPEIFWTLGVLSGANAMLPVVDRESYKADPSLYHGLAFQYHNDRFMYSSSVYYSKYSENIQKTYIEYSTFYTTKIEFDTVSYYIHEREGVREIIPIVEEKEVRALDSTAYDSSVVFKNNFSYISVPIQFGRRLRYGFLCIYGATGITGNFLHSAQGDGALLTKNDEFLEDIYEFSVFTADVNVEIVFSYLLTPRLIADLNFFGSYPVISSLKKTDYKYQTYSRMGAKVSFSFLFNSY